MSENKDSIAAAIAHNIREYPGGSAITAILIAGSLSSMFNFGGVDEMECKITDHDPTTAITTVVCEPD